VIVEGMDVSMTISGPSPATAQVDVSYP
jgi:hypothetical protein